MIKWFMLLAVSVSAAPDLVAPFTIDLKSNKGVWDTIIVTTYLGNVGTTATLPQTFDATIFSAGVDSFNLFGHRIPATLVLNPGSMVVYRDTLTVRPGPFSIFTWCDPLGFLGEGGGELVNNVRSQAYNFYPTVRQIHDTTVVYDTLRFRDTLRIVEKDTIRITLHDTTRVSVTDTIFQQDTIRVVVRDTVVKKDTVKYCPPTLAKAGSVARLVPVASVVYTAAGVKVWEGSLPLGGYPPSGLRPGLHLIVQGDQTRRFRVAYR